MKLPSSLAAAVIAGLACTPVSAVTDSVTINVSGTLTRPPCTLTSSKTLTANFGNLRYDQIASAPMIDIPVTLTCPPNSSLSISIKASNLVQGSTTQAWAGKDYLGYFLYLNSDNSAVDMTGVKRNLTNQRGTVDLSMKAKLNAFGAVSEGAFSASAVISIEYL
ncbi:fimbrial protein [Pseudomonas sp. UBA2684]|uniref:fimbrial protein n=1 Tax=Pseudomonas sp. UBA2684 TaxID=1947311 RepID=UPI000E96AD46|nr:spore coat protein U domain-containing protein [Pseudomonas sp. UBA2684]HBX54151.1 fimbrial protein [Pseudomonas sp.]|tara:strand:+ start:5500 stop:5991 length:492 start_codon:yes stop_codon:yes gene_type:complete